MESDNRIHIGSVTTNSFGIVLFNETGFSIHDNIITAEGVHPIGIGIISGSSNGEVTFNRVEVQNTAGGEEYGSTGSAGIRFTWGADNVEVRRNTFIVHAEKDLLGPGLDSWGRALWVGLPEAGTSVLFEQNTIIANNQGNGAKAAGIAVVCWNRSEGLVFRNNVVTSNWGNVLLGDSYGPSDGYPRFVGNTFKKTGTSPDYRTIRGGYRYRPATAFFMGNSYEDGAAFENMELYWNETSNEADWYEGKVKKDVARGGNCRILVLGLEGYPVDGVSVTITDNIG